MEKNEIQDKIRICKYCNKEIFNPSSSQKYHKECSKEVIKNKSREQMNFLTKYKQQHPEEFVKIPYCGGFSRTTYIYCNGMAKEIQKNVPRLMEKISIRLLNKEPENIILKDKKRCFYRTRSGYCSHYNNPEFKRKKHAKCIYKDVQECIYLKRPTSKKEATAGFQKNA